jgi:hypothetical protein
MGNGALPNGPSYRAHSRLYLTVISVPGGNSVVFGGEADIEPDFEYTQTARNARDWLQGPAIPWDEAPGVGGHSSYTSARKRKRGRSLEAPSTGRR